MYEDVKKTIELIERNNWIEDLRNYSDLRERYGKLMEFLQDIGFRLWSPMMARELIYQLYEKHKLDFGVCEFYSIKEDKQYCSVDGEKIECLCVIPEPYCVHRNKDGKPKYPEFILQSLLRIEEDTKDALDLLNRFKSLKNEGKEEGGLIMKKLLKEYISRLRPLLLEDEEKRDRGKFVYTFDILKKYWAVPFSIWPKSNIDVLRVISGGVAYTDLPFDPQNEVEKGMLFEDQRQFVSKHILKGQMLCEARDHKLCLKEKCSIFRLKNTEAGGKHGICSEFKISFKK